ncbi:hypothetical protein [Butyrivibrio sp. AE2032]|uniref:hypothetical protein n=1 Tax=Butyrivibrio sp. AE2032 TaxID=1458463 RepID=UPI00054D43D3|nr:hypothetical protein [Butyrivibrio sp. AE2032]
MRYDPEDKKYYFSTVMVPDEAETRAGYDHYKAYQQDSLSHPGTWAKNMMKDADGNTSTGKTAAGLIISFAFIACIVAAILCIPVKRYDLIPWFIGGLMLFIGLYTLITPDNKKTAGFAENAIFRRIGGVISLLGGIGLFAVSLIYPKENITLYAIALFCEIAVVVFLAVLVKLIGYINAPKSVYTKEVEATCIGYVRTYMTSSYGDSIPDENPYYSPVFEYHYEGEKYQSFYDVLLNGTNGTIPAGSKSKIKINPDSPSQIFGGRGDSLSGPLAFTLLSFAASVVLIILLVRFS